MRRLTQTVFVVLATSIVACGGGSSTPSDAGTPAGIQPTFSSIQTNIFTGVGCNQSSACHGSGQAGGLDLTPANAYLSLVGANGKGAPINDPLSSDYGEANAADAGLLVVDPGNPGNSFLYVKVNSPVPAQYGAQMPNGGLPALTAEQVTAISDWISAGAQNN